MSSARAALLGALVLSTATGCSLVWGPNRDDILDAGAMDGGVDGGLDAGFDASDALDAGDAGPDGCVPAQSRETACGDMMDDDCDGEVDCFDFDCRGNAACCTGRTTDSLCLAQTSGTDGFDRVPTDLFVFDPATPSCSAPLSLTNFGGGVNALVTRACQPVSFGMTIEASFELQADCPTGAVSCGWAALSLGPTNLVSGGRYDSELSVIVASDGSARVERGGAVLPDATFPPRTFVQGAPIQLSVYLEPGPSDANEDVLFAYVDVTQTSRTPPRSGRLLSRTAVLPLEDVRCLVGGASEPGLYVAIEGTGSQMGVQSPLGIIRNGCAAPSQFTAPAAGSVALGPAAACGTHPESQAGAPALRGYCVDGCDELSTAAFQWDLWVDASDRPRTDDDSAFIDFGLCGFGVESAELPSSDLAWTDRAMPDGAYLFSTPTSTREPTLLPLTTRDSRQVTDLAYAFAARVEAAGNAFDIYGGVVRRTPSAAPDPPALLLAAADVDGCDSLRDPLLLANFREVSTGVFEIANGWLLFTCDRGTSPDTIGLAPITITTAPALGPVERSMAVGDWLQAPPDASWAARGVYAPEGFTEAEGGNLTMRLWFFGRDGSGSVRLAYAQGRGPLGALPTPELYPANPILAPDAPVLGADCSGLCRFTGVSVTPAANQSPVNQFLFSRLRSTGTGFVNELVPLLQPRPLD